MILLYWEWHLIPRLPLWSIFARFPEQLLKDLIFWYFCPAADTHPKLLYRAVSGAWFLTRGVFECDIEHRQSVAVLSMLYKIRCNPMHPVNSTWTACASVGYTRCSGCTSVHLCASSLKNLAAVQQDFYFPLGVPLERSCWPSIR